VIVPPAAALDLLRAMLEITSPSYGEGALARYLTDAMGGLGFKTRLDATGNVIGEIDRGPGPVIMLLGHLDTVPGDITVRQEGGRLYGRGAVDAKGPLAAMACAAASAEGFRGRLVVAGVVEEETALSRGAVAVRETVPQPDALIVGEPSGWSTVVLGYKGMVAFRYHVECPATHATNPAAKASELAVAAWTTLLSLLHHQEEGTPSFDRPGAALTSIRADLTTGTASFSVRTPPGFDSAGLAMELRARLTAGELTVAGSVPACRVDRRDPVVQALSAGIRDHGGRPRAKLKSATSDMNTLAEAWRIPMATYGPGDSSLDHAANEHIEVGEYLRSISVLRAALAELSHLAHGGR
jgi:[amino group carrier protein]-lysine/ornithine hydrolase